MQGMKLCSSGAFCGVTRPVIQRLDLCRTRLVLAKSIDLCGGWHYVLSHELQSFGAPKSIINMMALVVMMFCLTSLSYNNYSWYFSIGGRCTRDLYMHMLHYCFLLLLYLCNWFSWTRECMCLFLWEFLLGGEITRR